MSGILGVVSAADAEHAEDSAGLAHVEAIFHPDGQRAERSLVLDLTEICEVHALVLVLEVSVTKESADALSASTEVEVVKLS